MVAVSFLLDEFLLLVQSEWQNKQLMSQVFPELCNLLLHLLKYSFEDVHLSVGEQGLGLLVVSGNQVILMLEGGGGWGGDMISVIIL